VRAVFAAIALLIALAVSLPSLAVQPGERMADPAQEARAREISAGLRCLVCQNQSIDDSDAPLARDLRVLVRDRIRAGETDTQIRDFVVARYGEYVLLKPPLGWHTLLLWLGPFLVLGAGVLGLLRLRARANAGPAGQALSEAEKAELERVLKG
jgi:cytochrome c-type biogenesis protein CcmH